MRARTVSVATTATLIANGGTAMNTDDVIILNPSGNETVYLGAANVSTATGFPLAAGGVFEWALSGDSIYGIVASGTETVNVAEKGD